MARKYCQMCGCLGEKHYLETLDGGRRDEVFECPKCKKGISGNDEKIIRKHLMINFSLRDWDYHTKQAGNPSRHL